MKKQDEVVKPFGLEFLEEIEIPADLGLGGSDHTPNQVCCTTYMSDLKAGGDDNISSECVPNVDMCDS